MELMFQPLVKYADFDGRARRSEYWLFHLLLWAIFLCSVMSVGAVAASAGSSADGTGLLSFSILTLVVCIAGLGVFIPSLAVLVRRIHDTGNSGWWVLIAFVPFLGGVVLFIFSLIDGTAGPNRFGPDPKDRQPFSPPPTEVHHYHHTAPGPAGETPPPV
jgi:uncharacterized membrane protein YhaH (DUF805 family)